MQNKQHLCIWRKWKGNNFEYFCKISTIDGADVELPRFESRTETFLSDITVEQSEVIDVLSILKVNKTTGPDGISHRMLRQTSKSVPLPLCRLFNLSHKTNTQLSGKSHM